MFKFTSALQHFLLGEFPDWCRAQQASSPAAQDQRAGHFSDHPTPGL